MNVICMNDEAFFALIEIVVAKAKEQNKLAKEWVAPQEAMVILNIKSKTTLQRLRDEGKIEYSQIGRKLIQYKVKSLFDYLNEHKREKF